MSQPLDRLVADNLEIWTGATLRKSGAGRGGGKRISLYGIERLRALILDLAVRGKLVPQDAGDEPASKYLLTASQRVDAASAKGRRKQILPSLDLTPELPLGWSPTHLGSIVDIVRGITFPGSEKSKTPEFGRVACLRTSNVQDQIEWDDILYIRDKFVSRADQYVRHNDIIISMANSRELVGKVAIIERDPEDPTAFGGFLAAIRAHSVDPRFLMTFLRCPTTKAQLIDDASQTTNIANISLSKLNPLPVPLPPLAEQRRIVAKVDELMALCDALERESAGAMAAHQTLVEELLATLVNSASAADLAANWARLERHFDTLFTTDASIEALKQTILDLAVRGKLVEQEEGDEAASKLLARIRSQANSTKKAGRIARGENRAPVNFPFSIPSLWEWSTLGELSEEMRYGTSKKCERDESLTPVLRIPNVSGGTVNLDDMKFGPLNARERSDLKLKEGDLLIIRSNGSLDIVGRFAVVPDLEAETAFAGYLVRARLDQSCIVPKYIWHVSNSAWIRDKIEGPIRHGVGLKNLNLTELSALPIPIPPLEEQHRIVAKVDALMALCDQLKTRLADAAQTQRHLADAITERAAA